MKELKERIHENGMDYVLCGDYYIPEIIIPKCDRPIGHYGRLRKADLKKRLTAYADKYPDLCKLTDEDEETGYKSFLIAKRRFSIRLTAPYSDERRHKASAQAKKQATFL